jgi:hypothetical protein
VVEGLPSMHVTLQLIPTTAKKESKTQQHLSGNVSIFSEVFGLLSLFDFSYH